MGVTLSVTSLVMALIQDRPEAYKGSYVKAAQRLKRIAIDNDISEDYLYYKVPCPWIQVKFLKILQYYPPSGRNFRQGWRRVLTSPTEDTHVREIIRESVQRILQNAIEMPKNVQQNNAQNAVLFEAINLLIHLDTEHNLMMQISSKLGKFIQSRETNVRYLGLDAMTHFAARAETLDPIKKHQNIIIGSLRDRDISVRRKGLDLLYSMCDTTNAQPIVNELLRYLQNADFAIREEMVLKIAILTEKYATDARWYVDISLRLLAMAGEHVSDEVWQRVVQIVTNNEELQIYAVSNILQYVKGDSCHDTLIKIGGYLLGEFGHLIADNKGCSPIEQFMALQSKMMSCSDSTRALLLSSFVKFVNLFPEIRPQLLSVFAFYSHSPDSELQQRACEYLTLATMPTDDLLRTVCDEMPPFSERASVLLSRLHQKSIGTSEKRTWVVGGKDANADKKEILMAQKTGLKRTFTGIVNGTSAGPPEGISSRTSTFSPVDKPSTNGSSTSDLAGLDMNGHSEASLPNLASAAHLTPDWEPGFNRLFFAVEGLLFEDAQIQVGVRSEYRAHIGVLKLYFTNKSSFPVGSFTTTLDNASPEALKIDTKSLPEPNVGAGQQVQQTAFFMCKGPFEESPTIRLSYLAGALQAYTLKLPVLPHKYMEPSELSAEDFFKRWKQIGAGPLEAQNTFGLATSGKGARTMDPGSTQKVVEGFKWRILTAVDPNPKNVVGCAVFQMEKGKCGCLLRLEPNYEQKVRPFRSFFSSLRHAQDPKFMLTKRCLPDVPRNDPCNSRYRSAGSVEEYAREVIDGVRRILIIKSRALWSTSASLYLDWLKGRKTLKASHSAYQPLAF